MSKKDGQAGPEVKPASSAAETPYNAKGPNWHTRLAELYEKYTYTPKRCRYNPEDKFEFSMSLNLLFGFAATFTVANLYYNHPILNKIAQDFHVTDEQASYVPTLSQAGYAAGMLLINPIGDLVKRRALVLWLVFFTATVWLGLCITNNFGVFLALSFISCFTTVTPQIMLPLVGDLAPAHRRATAISIVTSGLILGILVARLLSGIVANYIHWRYIYWIAFGLQYLIVILLYFYMPDYPSTNPGVSIIRKYPILLFDIVRLAFRHPVLMQAGLVGLFTSSTFTSYWTTLTFLLAGPPYHYDSLKIGLFALIGIGSMSWGPIFARTFMDKHVPWLSVFIGLSIALVGIVIGTYTGEITAAGPAIQAALIDIGLQTSQIGNRTAIYAVEPKARNRVNTTYMFCVFCGQLMGTAAGNHLYAQGGWTKSGSASVGFICVALLFCVIRGPHEKGWVGWRGGHKMTKPKPPKASDTIADEERAGVSEEPVPEPFAPEGPERSPSQEPEKKETGSDSDNTLRREGNPEMRQSGEVRDQTEKQS